LKTNLAAIAIRKDEDHRRDDHGDELGPAGGLRYLKQIDAPSRPNHMARVAVRVLGMR